MEDESLHLVFTNRGIAGATPETYMSEEVQVPEDNIYTDMENVHLDGNELEITYESIVPASLHESDMSPRDMKKQTYSRSNKSSVLKSINQTTEQNADMNQPSSSDLDSSQNSSNESNRISKKKSVQTSMIITNAEMIDFDPYQADSNEQASSSNASKAGCSKGKKRPARATVTTSTNRLLAKKMKQTTINPNGKLNASASDEITDGGGGHSLFVRTTQLNKYYKLVDSGAALGHYECLYQDTPTSETCGKILTKCKSGYWNLKRHLETQHNVNLKSLEDKVIPKVTDFIPRQKSYSKGHPKQRKFEEHMIDLICVGSQKLDLFHDVTFLKLINMLDPQINIVSRRTIIRHIHKAAEGVKVRIMEEISELEKRSVHVSCDIWTSRRRHGIFGVIIHYINQSWILMHRLIGFRVLESSHTAQNISEKFLEVVGEFGLSNERDKIGFVTSDNAANMIAAFNLLSINFEENIDMLDDMEREVNKDCLPAVSNYHLETSQVELGDELGRLVDLDRVSKEDLSEVLSDVSECSELSNDDLTTIAGWVGCNAHTLQLVINTAIKKDPSVQAIIKYVHSLMLFFKKSVASTELLRAKTNVDVLMPGQTRWNSVMDMLKRFLNEEFFAAIRTVLEDVQKVTKGKKVEKVPQPPTLVQQRQANELYKLLKPFGIATDYLQSEGPTAGTFLLTMTHSYERVKKTVCTYFSNFQTELLCEFMKRFSNRLAYDQWILSAFLDPRIKLTVFQAIHSGGCGADWGFPSLDNITDNIKSTIYIRQQADLFKNNPEALQPTGTSDDFEGNIFELIKPHCKPMRPEEEEFTAYSQETTLAHAECPLQYWKQNSNRFPILSQLARNYLALPVTSGTIERVYSIAGNYIRARRARTTPENVEAMLLVRQERKSQCLADYLKH